MLTLYARLRQPQATHSTQPLVPVSTAPVHSALSPTASLRKRLALWQPHYPLRQRLAISHAARKAG